MSIRTLSISASQNVKSAPRPTITFNKWMRLFIEEIGGPSIELVSSIWEITAVNPDGLNFLLPVDTIVTASSTYAGTATGRVIDGDLTTRWQSGSNKGANSWLRFQLAKPIQVSDIVLKTPGEESWHHDYPRRLPKTFRIETSSNGTSWTTVKRFADIPLFDADETRKFSLVD